MIPETVRYRPHNVTNFSEDCVTQFREWYDFRYAISNLFKNQLSLKYSGSILGSFWYVLNPILNIIPMAIILPLIARFKTPDYVVYLFSATICWGFITSSLSEGANSLISQSSLIKKVYLPKGIFPLVTVMVHLVNAFFAIVAFLIIGLLFSLNFKMRIFYLLGAFWVTFIFCLGLAMLLSILTIYFRDIKQIQSVIMRAFFFLSPILYPISVIPEPYRVLMQFNPFYHFIMLFRSALYDPVAPGLQIFFIPLAIALASLVIGLFTHWRRGKILIYRL